MLIIIVLLVSLYKIGDFFKNGGNIIVFDYDTLREVKRSRGKVQHTLNTCVYDRYNQLRSSLCRQGNDYHADFVIGNYLLKVVHVVARNIIDLMSNLLRIDVEGSGNA